MGSQLARAALGGSLTCRADGLLRDRFPPSASEGRDSRGLADEYLHQIRCRRPASRFCAPSLAPELHNLVFQADYTIVSGGQPPAKLPGGHCPRMKNAVVVEAPRGPRRTATTRWWQRRNSSRMPCRERAARSSGTAAVHPSRVRAPSRSSAAWSTTRRASRREHCHHQVQAQVQALRKSGDVDQPQRGGRRSAPPRNSGRKWRGACANGAAEMCPLGA